MDPDPDPAPDPAPDPTPDLTPDPTPFFIDFKDAKKIFILHIFFL
jgi:autotransporter family porin